MGVLIFNSPAEKTPIKQNSVGQVSVTLSNQSYWEFADTVKFALRDIAGNILWSATASYSSDVASVPINYSFPSGNYIINANSCGLAGFSHCAISRDIVIV